MGALALPYHSGIAYAYAWLCCRNRNLGALLALQFTGAPPLSRLLHLGVMVRY